jgi:hypothetical protein
LMAHRALQARLATVVRPAPPLDPRWLGTPLVTTRVQYSTVYSNVLYLVLYLVYHSCQMGMFRLSNQRITTERGLWTILVRWFITILLSFL